MRPRESFSNASHPGEEGGGELLLLAREPLLKFLSELLEVDDLPLLRERVEAWQKELLKGKSPRFPRGKPGSKGNGIIPYSREALLSQLEQILSSRTLERARYYLARLQRSLEEERTNGVNEINLLRWKEYPEILTDSLWIVERRERSGAHLAWYWGNFIPQIPRQMMLRYTKSGEWVLDPFAGSATTLIECRRLGRNGVGVEIVPEVVEKAREFLEREPNPRGVITELYCANSLETDFARLLARYRIPAVQLLILHPPYHDIIPFSSLPQDLSNAPGIPAFLDRFEEVVERTSLVLEKGRFMALVIGDKYEKGEWIPLGFSCMERVLRQGYLLKSIIVKNFEDTRAKRSQKELWRYRALLGGFYVFKHEYIMVFQKK